MQRLQTAVAACCNDPSIRVVLDINPDHWENLAYINAALPGEFLAHDRIKELFRQRNVKYFMVDEISPIFTDEDPGEITQIVGLIDKHFDEYAEAIAELQEE